MLLLGILAMVTLGLRLMLLVVIIEMREPMRRRGAWAVTANNCAILSAVLLAANSAIGLSTLDMRGVPPPLVEQMARFFMPLATAIALLILAVASAAAMRAPKAGAR